MGEHPILFSGPMVRTILAGQKTQTRRVVKPQPSFPCGFEKIVSVLDPWHADAFVGTPGEGVVKSSGPRERQWHLEDWSGNLVARWDVRCPYGVPGDLLWVRETWDFRPWGDRVVRVAYAADGDQSGEIRVPDGWNPMLYNYARWRPSIHMPRWASRLTLRVTDVRVERVQEISHADAIAEGCADPTGHNAHRFHFADVWDTLNAKRGHGWDANPWVWVISFERGEADHG